MGGRSGVDRLFEELEVECGASVQCITERVSALMGLDIEVDVLDEDEWATVPRFVLGNGDRARIPVRRSDPRWYRLHVVLHELAHLLCGHTSCAALPMTFDQLRKPAEACVLAGAGVGMGAAMSAGLSTVSREQDQQEEREAEARALAHRLGLFVEVPHFASAEAALG
jgi:hypothetical protein